MRTKNILLILFLFGIGFLPLQAQNLVTLNASIVSDTVFAVSQKSDVISKAMYASGQVAFSSKSGYVRISLTDDSSYDLLVYESFPLLATKGVDIFDHIALETGSIPSFFSATKIRIEIKNAELKKLSIDASSQGMTKEQQQKAKTDKIAVINKNLREQNALWEAGETPISQMAYQEKKGLFGGKVPDLQGFDYYTGGIFELSDGTEEPALKSAQNTNGTLSDAYAPSFDWRNRHGANNPSSPYYNSGGHGWITSVKNQASCGSCAIFSVLGTTEALANLYYNRFLNKDLSEQNIVSCYTYGNCAAGRNWNPGLTIDYITTNGVCEESCFPYTATDLPCSDKCPSPMENMKVSGRINCGTVAFPKTVDAIKKNIIQYGPISGGVLDFSHAMPIIGYKKIQAGDTIYTTMSNYVIIPNGDSRIGQTAWLFKNSWGSSWGKSQNGFAYILLPDISQIDWTHVILSPITSPNYTDADIVCEDRDSDGYYFWGVGPKPAHCPPCAPDKPDGDDSNPNLGPMNEYGYCEAITPLSENITTSQTWNTNRTVCRNLVIQSGATLTITATVFMQAHKVTIQDGGKIILSGGTIDNGNIIAQSGSELTITNNGKILLGSSDNLNIQLGAIFEIAYGKILLK
ncbi:MAG: hypothetical protein LBM08_04690 [Dysgonamonadaceae bacterium]|jgi:hypothetical protein|nr:hypothetical protein [Dysgonamonadaceae bacterium]